MHPNAVRCLLAMALALTLNAQAPNVQNGNITTQPAAGALKSTIESLIAQSAEPRWIGYSVPMLAGDGSMCCFDGGGGNCCRGCSLEERNNNGVRKTGARQPSQLDPDRDLQVLIRAEAGKLDKIRIFSSECPLDANGRNIVWLTGANPQQSVDYLAGHVTASDWTKGPQKKIADAALMAIIHHADSKAEAAAKDFIAPARPRELKKQTAFWLCTARGKNGLDIVRAAIRNDSGDDGFRKEAMFPLSVSQEPGAIDDLIQFAKNDASSRVREQAIFWLSQKAGKKAAATISEAIEKDPETQVKKQAVFALSQLPKDEGVPLLIQIAKTNRNSEVRKQAMFWLGQSNDPRALSFFEEVLAK